MRWLSDWWVYRVPDYWAEVILPSLVVSVIFGCLVFAALVLR
jgi:hypothetical protein